ncbi:VWA domain-containing protein [Nocardioides sp.]|uniref:VWA domain-containing protein n=1 Tax=Nocardioides sp. TaxID=35761 RepID=UPI002620193A|nr:VWA domain-containing protein [Nocardioides sp.]
MSAVVGCAPDALDPMGLALMLTTVSPEIGGVLIRGQKGTAKSTAVRALGALVPPLVELPIGATEDRVLGSIQLEQALAHGKVEVEKGLLARADGGLLYVDEVNLLHDHLVDLLLDAAATGRVTVERDGISVEHAARFVLIGTMNPEEGELRPQLLDRFGLTVEVAAPLDPAARVEVVRRRMAYDADPTAFCERYAAADAAIAARIVAARAAVAVLELSDAALLAIARICAGFEVEGLRADIVTARTALAHAAWHGRTEVTRADLRAAALLTLPHRRRRNPFDEPGLDEALLDALLDAEDLPDPEPDPETDPEPPSPPTPPSSDGTDGSDGDSNDEPSDGPSEEPAEAPAAPGPEDSVTPPAPAGNAPTSQVGASTPYRARMLRAEGVGEGAAGRRSRATSSTGRRIGARPAADGPGALHLVETIKAAAGRPGERRPGDRLTLAAEDLRIAEREGRESNLILFCVDASGSMAARKRMRQVKTAVLSLLLDAYRRRDKVGLVTFAGASSELVLPPTTSTDVAAARLDDLAAGGRTPLAEGLLEAARVLARERRRDPKLRPVLIVVTDGRATGGADPARAVERSRAAAAHLAGLGVTTVVIDGESGPMRLGLAKTLAVHLGAEYLSVDQVDAAVLTDTARAHVAPTTWSAA